MRPRGCYHSGKEDYRYASSETNYELRAVVSANGNDATRLFFDTTAAGDEYATLLTRDDVGIRTNKETELDSLLEEGAYEIQLKVPDHAGGALVDTGTLDVRSGSIAMPSLVDSLVDVDQGNVAYIPVDAGDVDRRCFRRRAVGNQSFDVTIDRVLPSENAAWRSIRNGSGGRHSFGAEALSRGEGRIMTRQGLLVGSMPFENETEAMRRALEILDGRLISLADGEIGERTEEFPRGTRAAWVMVAINRLAADTEHWHSLTEEERTEAGFPVDYESTRKLKAKLSPRRMAEHLRFGYDEFFKRSYPEFLKLRRKHDVPDLRFQMGVPTGLGIAFTAMRPLDALRYASAFNARIAAEVNEAAAVAGDDLVVQIELPAELAMAYRLPPMLLSLATRSALGLVRRITAGTSIGVHICFGDLNREALVHAETLDKLASFSNALVSRWPETRPLEYVHYPLAEGKEPPELETGFYAPLSRIRLPQDARFVAGFVHPGRNEGEHLRLRDVMDKIRGHQVDVAASCGLGRMDREQAEYVMGMMATLLE